MISLNLVKVLRSVSSCLIIGMVSLSLVGCDNMSKQTFGTGVGAVAGGLVGSRFGGGSGQVAATVAGAAGGALIGNAVGGSMDQSDRVAAQQQAILDANAVNQYSYGNDADAAYVD